MNLNDFIEKNGKKWYNQINNRVIIHQMDEWCMIYSIIMSLCVDKYKVEVKH